MWKESQFAIAATQFALVYGFKGVVLLFGFGILVLFYGVPVALVCYCIYRATKWATRG